MRVLWQNKEAIVIAISDIRPLGFQENTFSVDSLHQILNLLTALDRHSFTLLTSLTVGSRSRTRDLWIFIGPPSETPSLESPPASPAGSSLELKRETPHVGCVSFVPQSCNNIDLDNASGLLRRDRVNTLGQRLLICLRL